MDLVEFEELPAKLGKLGVIILNRPQALNALTHAMFIAMIQQLQAWEKRTDIVAVLIKSNSEKAFCAGGDLRALYDARAANNLPEEIKFFKDEYWLDAYIGRYPKPYIALLHGIVMGGGGGISIHGSHRVACESLVFATPETGIGLFPDVGASHFLNKAPGYLGRYIGLSGARLNVADAVYANLVDYYVSSSHFDELQQALLEAPIGDGNAHDEVSKVLARFAIQADESGFKSRQDFIDGIFCGDQVSTILDYLSHDDAEWSQAVYTHLKEKSPISMMVTLEALKRAKGQSLDFVMKQDYCIVQSMLQGHDLYEGIRAVIVDKDQHPKWDPASLDAISDDQVARYFDNTNKDILDL